MANKATRSIDLSPIVRRKYTLKGKDKFLQVWRRCAKEGLGVKDVAHILNWHIDDVISYARHMNSILNVAGQSLPMLRNF